MPGSRLSLDTVRTIIDDAASLGIRWIRFYGGEPLVHTDLSSMVEYATSKGIRSWISTNGWLLNGSRFKQLRAAGLGTVNIGLYGIDKTYDDYVQKPGAFETLVRNLEELRAVSADHRLHFSWLLAPNTCNLEQLRGAWQLAQRFDAHFQVDIVHEDGVLPYFTDGPDHCLKLDRSIPKVETLVQELIQIRTEHPSRYSESAASIRAIPDWIRPGKIKAPCDMYKHIWIGADGSVKLCYPAFPLGNINKTRLTEVLYTEKHVRAAQSAFQLKCPQCHCNRITRVQRDFQTRAQYGWAKSPAPTGALDPALALVDSKE
jgi:cyclic pyranopterin phosphate synthase